MYNSTETALIVTMTIGELKGLIAEVLGEAMRNSALKTAKHSNNLVYGIRGIEKLFGVSHKTAQYYKDHLIKEAVMQNGRKIVVDADLALKLFNDRRAK